MLPALLILHSRKEARNSSLKPILKERVMMFQGCLPFLAAIVGQFFDIEDMFETTTQLTAEERFCCGSFLAEEPLPKTCSETRCPFFSPPIGEGDAKEVQGLASPVLVTLISASLFVALAAWHGTFPRVICQSVVHSLGELLIVGLVYFLCGFHLEGFTWIANYVYWTSSWKAGVSSSILFVGLCGVTQLKPNQVYVLMESLLATMVSPAVLVCLGTMSMNDALVCLGNMSIPIAILVGVRARGTREKSE